MSSMRTGTDCTIVVDCIPAIEVINVSVQVIIDSVVRNLSIVFPEIKILMSKRKTTIDYCHNNCIPLNRQATGGNVPGTLCIYIITCCTVALSSVIPVPFACIKSIVRGSTLMHIMVELGKLYINV